MAAASDASSAGLNALTLSDNAATRVMSALVRIRTEWLRTAPGEERATVTEALKTQLIAERQDLEGVWLNSGGTLEQLTTGRVQARLGLPRDGLKTDVEVALQTMMNAVHEMIVLHEQFDLIPKGDQSATASVPGSPRDRMQRVLGVLHLCRRMIMIQDAAEQMSINPTAVRDGLSDQLRLELSFPKATEMTDFQNFLWFLLSQLRDRGYRRLGNSCFEAVFTPEGNNTRAWKNVCTIGEFIARVTQKETAFDQWCFMTKNPRNAGNAEEYLMRHTDRDFMPLNANRYIKSFRNGIYFILKDKFYRYEDPALAEEGHFDSDKYFDLMFDETDISVPVKLNDGTFLRDEAGEIVHRNNHFLIPTPTLDIILDTQQFTHSVKAWAYAFIGRMLYEIGMLDNWQVMPVWKGVTQCGKSLLGSLIAAFFQPEDVRILSSNMEKVFGLSALRKCKIWLCMEMQSTWNLPQSELNSMVTGEAVNVPIKNHDAVTMEWKSPGAMFGNTDPRWLEGGSIARRLAIFSMRYRVRDPAPEMKDKLLKELGAIMRKCNGIYQVSAEMYQTHDVWKVLPQPFIAEQKRLRKNVSPLLTFLDESGLKFGPGLWMSNNDFKELFHKYCDRESVSKRVPQDLQALVFNEFGLERVNCDVPLPDPSNPRVPVRDDSHPSGWRSVTGSWVKGLCKPEDQLFQEACMAAASDPGPGDTSGPAAPPAGDGSGDATMMV